MFVGVVQGCGWEYMYSRRYTLTKESKDDIKMD